MSDITSLVADIGGTNTRVALAQGAVVDQGSIRRYRNADHGGIDSVLRAYLGDTGVADAEIGGACVAAAGPVRDGVAVLTNLDWRIDRTVLGRTLTATKLAVLNDLQAQGHAIGNIAPQFLEMLLPQRDASLQAAKLVVGLGTGFNAAPVYDTAAGRFVPPSEAGHISLPVCCEATIALAAGLKRDHGFAAVEEALSGRGVERIHHLLHGQGSAVAEIMAALGRGEVEAVATARVFVRILGTVVGDLALTHLPFGGIYLVGGVARAFAPHLMDYGFADAMHDKGRFGPFVEQFGVTVVSDDYAALTGCASHLAHL